MESSRGGGAISSPEQFYRLPLMAKRCAVDEVGRESCMKKSGSLHISSKLMFLKILQVSLKKTCVGVSFK